MRSPRYVPLDSWPTHSWAARKLLPAGDLDLPDGRTFVRIPFDDRQLLDPNTTHRAAWRFERDGLSCYAIVARVAGEYELHVTVVSDSGEPAGSDVAELALRLCPPDSCIILDKPSDDDRYARAIGCDPQGARAARMIVGRRDHMS